MNIKPQIIYEAGKPAFAVIPYDEYLALVKEGNEVAFNDKEFVPFVLNDYIHNPIRCARIEAAVTQGDLAQRMGVTQGYISKIEGRNYKVGANLLKRVQSALQETK